MRTVYWGKGDLGRVLQMATHVIDLLPAYVLDCLEEDETLLVAEHLAVCPVCREELASYQDVADELALAAPVVSPPVDLKARLMAQLHPPLARGERVRRPWWHALAGFAQRAMPVWAAVSLVLVIALAASNLMLWQRVNQPVVMRTVALEGTAIAPRASGLLVISAAGGEGALIVDGLPPLDEAHQYQLWLIKDGRRVSGGIFSVEPDGDSMLWVSAPGPLTGYDAFGVTIEPTGGSPGPTGDKVLGGSL